MINVIIASAVNFIVDIVELFEQSNSPITPADFQKMIEDEIARRRLQVQADHDEEVAVMDGHV